MNSLLFGLWRLSFVPAVFLPAVFTLCARKAVFRQEPGKWSGTDMMYKFCWHVFDYRSQSLLSKALESCCLSKLTYPPASSKCMGRLLNLDILFVCGCFLVFSLLCLSLWLSSCFISTWAHFTRRLAGKVPENVRNKGLRHLLSHKQPLQKISGNLWKPHHTVCELYLVVLVTSLPLCVRDKAGGYGIQALGGMLVEYVHGDFLNVVGFPLNHFCKQLDLIYNRCTSASDQESASGHLSQSGPHPTSVHTQLPHNLPDPSCQSPSSSAKHNSSASLRPNSPPASQTLHTLDNPSLSPVHKVCTFHLMSKIHQLVSLTADHLF